MNLVAGGNDDVVQQSVRPLLYHDAYRGCGPVDHVEGQLVEAGFEEFKESARVIILSEPPVGEVCRPAEPGSRVAL